MKKVLVLAMVLMAALAGCAPAAQNETVQDAAEGTLSEGVRVIALEEGFSAGEINVYRGETVRFTYNGEGSVSIELPEFDVAASGEGHADVTVKAKEVGDYALVAGGETGSFKVVEYQKEGQYFKVGPEDFEAQMNDEYLLLDVRTAQEYAEGYIDGATLIPVQELSGRVGEIEEYDKVLVYCRSGNRSVAASEILLEAGFGEVYDLQGGIGAWLAYKNE